MDDREMNILDVLSLFNFTMSLKNYNENVDQSKMNDAIILAVDDIHDHLRKQDDKLSNIESLLERSVNHEAH